MNPSSTVAPSCRARFGLGLALGLALGLGLAGAGARSASAGPADLPASLTDGLSAELSFVAERAHSDGAAVGGGDLDVTAVGVGMGFGGSLYAVATPPRPPRTGFRIRDAWRFRFATGYASGDTERSYFLQFDLEATLRPVYMVNADLDVFGRAGYMVGWDTARMQPGCSTGNDCLGWGQWLVTGGVRTGKVYAEAGVGWSSDVNARIGGYRMATVQYHFRAAYLFSYVGLRYVGTTVADPGDPSTHALHLILQSH